MPRKTCYTAIEAAQIIGVTRQTLDYHIKTGALKPMQPSTEKYSRIYISLAELARFQAIPRQTGRRKMEPQPKRPRGRPPKPKSPEPTPKRPRGRPKKEK